MSHPRFSVVVPTCNRAAVLPTALGSVLSQTETDFELIVVDDGSTDGTEAVVRALDDPRIRYLRQERAGVSSARNAGAVAARGEYLVFLDDDDELLPVALARFADAAAENDWDVVHAGWIRVSRDRRDWRTVLPRLTDVDFQRGSFLPGTVAIKRALFARVEGYDPGIRYGENTVLAWKVREVVATGACRTGVLDEPLVIRYAGALRAYDLARYTAAREILDKHGDVLANPAVGSASPRRRRATYLGIAALGAARLGRRREAIGDSLRAVANDPTALARYRNLLSVLRACLRRPTGAPGARGDGDAGPAPAPDSAGRAGARGVVHAIVVTFGRPESLAKVVADAVHAGVDTLTVVDNAPSEPSKEAALSVTDRIPVSYVPMTENGGPAGGYAVGMELLLRTATDDDWILTLDDDRMTGSPASVGELREFAGWLLDHGAPVGAVGLVGARFDRRRGRLVRLRDDELAGPVAVDYVGGGQLLMVRVAAAREIGTFDPDIFFAFDDLDYCMRLSARGFGIYVNGPIVLEARERFSRLGEVGASSRRESPWRRYFGVRNHIVVMRRYVSWPRALVVTLAQLLGRPLQDVRLRRKGVFSLAAAGARGCVDAWTGRLGRRMDPTTGT